MEDDLPVLDVWVDEDLPGRECRILDTCHCKNEAIIVVRCIDKVCGSQLFVIGELSSCFCRFFCLSEDREKDRRQDGDDRDDNQQFNECERLCGSVFHVISRVNEF